MNGAAPASSALCGGCRIQGSCRLGLTSWSVDPADRSTTARGTCPGSWHAGPGVAFGGWTAAVFDDVLGRTILALGELPKTASLHVEFRRPVPVDQALVIHTREVGRDGRRRLVAARLTEVGTGDVLAVAEATMVVAAPEETPRPRGPRPDFIDRHLALRRSAHQPD
jgi:acyl-CoA thioesterase FadM